ncbi:predicted protein [Postia placenta Mad-698-R]|uniref:FAD-binding PCMH-type domain-containing protein n=1 Tax=Postia placenta MAD-698-R-SB12 TaxID=670580 RepID=A0A1X6MK94_9APHY|nr:hypothetical protein POSPLADRAFT_1186342 [Postia placenta MAD-698-R-SB12]EED78329.1 predicted protein [Postia placenta Mad-698-R]OSX56738.1 hypothetical protein POSPLADRAFT_1186342 [Postia placenta MAD-698-R-SB12]
MFATVAFSSLSSFLLFNAVYAADGPTLQTRGVIQTFSVCEEIGKAVSSQSAVFYPLHNYPPALSSLEHQKMSAPLYVSFHMIIAILSTSGVQLQILGKTNTPFAVKGGGHASNPGFSSTAGVQITMSRFSGVTYHSDSQTVDIGSGLIWDDVYAALEPYGVNVVGGRVTGVGVAGFTLGGVMAYQLVLPNGTISDITASSNPDLFFALKGGFNNFGIVTQFTLKTFPQGQVWGGTILALGEFDKIATATANFYANVTDPKASIISTFNWDLGIHLGQVSLFYDGSSPPDGMFDEFMAIPAVSQDISSRSFLSLVLSSVSNETSGLRGYFDTVSLYDITPSMLTAVSNETTYWASQLAWEVPGLFLSYDIEPFLPSMLSHGSDSAWPPKRDRAILPMNIYYAWDLSLSDTKMGDTMRTSSSHLTELAVLGGQDVTDAPLYPNYALYGTPLSRMYGDNLPRLQAIKAQYDPNNVMGLAGGWKF